MCGTAFNNFFYKYFKNEVNEFIIYNSFISDKYTVYIKETYNKLYIHTIQESQDYSKEN